MENFRGVAGGDKHLVKRCADEFAATDDGDFFVCKVNVVAGEEPKNSGGSGRVKLSVTGEAIDVFFRGDCGSEGVGLIFQFGTEGELENNAMNLGIVIRGGDGGFNVV